MDIFCFAIIDSKFVSFLKFWWHSDKHCSRAHTLSDKKLKNFVVGHLCSKPTANINAAHNSGLLTLWIFLRNSKIEAVFLSPPHNICTSKTFSVHIVQDVTKQTFISPQGLCTYVFVASQKPIWMNELCLAQDIRGMITPWVQLPGGLLCLLCYFLIRLEPDAHQALWDTIPSLRREDWELLSHDTVIHLRFRGW